MNHIQQLKKLRNNLANSKVSVMVGAGFSKNVSQKFLTWDQLLHDLCYELFKEEIDREYRSVISTSIHRRKARSQFVQQKVREIISQVGYLNIVTKYIERKGYNESIANYIEDRIPDVELKNGKLYMTVGEKIEELNYKKLNLHKQLLALPWNNVYTTNYDRLLEICVDPDLYNKLVKERNELENEIFLLNNEELQCRDELEKVEAEKAQNPFFETGNEPIEKFYSETNFTNEADATNRKRDSEEKIDVLKSKVKENEKLIRYKEAALNDCFTVVNNASQLRIKRNKNIIKLHGSLRTKEEKKGRQFGFDGDPNTHYIIAKEHYDSYPKKHEAYTQLMRISLLQESFCLIGFSGIDPNFLAWIGWIRDLLFKHVSDSGKEEDFKIFLIDVNDHLIEEDKELFFRNHSIVRLPLLQPEIIRFLEAETQTQLDTQIERSSALKMFFEFLSNHEDVTTNAPALDLLYRERRRGIWKAMKLHGFNKAIPTQIVESAVKQLNEVGTQIVVGDTHYGYNHNQHFLIGAAEQMLSNQLKEFPNSVESLLELLLHAVEAENMPIKFALTKHVIDALLSCSKTSEKTKALIERNLSLTPFSIGENDIVDSQSYDFILRRAFQFQFDQLKDALEKWNPPIEQLHLKAGFYALFNQNKAEELLTKQLDEGERLNGEQRLFSMELLAFIKQSNFKQHNLRFDKKLNRTIRQYEQAGFERVMQHLEYYQEQLQPKLPKPLPYGKNRYSVSSSISFKVHDDKETALQYLMLLVKSGFQLCFDHVNSIPADKWYPIFSKAFEDYPLPFIFYSLQHSSEDFLKRVGQDVAYSEKLENELPAICKMLLKGYWSAPGVIQENILSFLSRLFIAVPPEVWQDSFLKIWKRLANINHAFNDRNSDAHSFITEGIKFISSESILYDIIEDCLQYADQYSNQAIDYLFTLNGNRNFKTINKSHMQSSLVHALDHRIIALSKNPQTNMFILGNLHAVLSPNQIEQIELQLNDVDFASIKNERIWHVFLYFAKGKKNLTDKIKRAILSHSLLWHTGIDGNSVHMLHGFLSLSTVTRFNQSHDSKGITWKKEEVQFIYERMKHSLSDIDRVMAKDSSLVSFGNILEEMKLFLDNFKIELEELDDFDPIYQKIKSLYDQEREYDALGDGLSSQDHKQIVWALGELSKRIELGNIDEDLLFIVMNRLLFQLAAGLEACLAYVARWLKDKNNGLLFEKYIPVLEKVLAKFKVHREEEVDVAFVEEKLIRIAFILKSWGEDSEIVNWWIDKAYSSRYNNIKQFLLKDFVTNLPVA
jgi:hypothetical protein